MCLFQEAETYSQVSQLTTERDTSTEVDDLSFVESVTESDSMSRTETTPERQPEVRILHRNELLAPSSESGINVELYRRSSSSYLSFIDWQDENERRNFLEFVVYSMLMILLISIVISFYIRYRNSEKQQ